MSDETLQLLKAFIDAAGYDVRGEIVSANNYNQQTRTVYKVTKKKRKPRETKQEGYTDDFEKLWRIYPKGHCGGKAATYRQYRARLDQHLLANESEYQLMVSGLNRYIKYIDATGYSVKSSETFFGRDRHYTNDFAITDKLKSQNREKQPWEFIPENDNHLIGFIEKHGFKKCGMGETVFETRKRLQAEIRTRIELEG